jgi:predicted MFS family arabinose efflux permease
MVFPERMRATITATFLAGGLFGQVAGVALGGLIAPHFGWRAAFGVIGFGGLMLGLISPLAVRGKWIAAAGERSTVVSRPAAKLTYGSLSHLFRGRLLVATYIAGGLQFYVVGALPAWLPTFLVRYHGLPIKQAASLAALFLMLSGLGMILCGISADRLAPRDPSYKARFAVAISLAFATASTIALLLPIGTAQLVMLAAVMFFAARTTGACGAIVAA